MGCGQSHLRESPPSGQLKSDESQGRATGLLDANFIPPRVVSGRVHAVPMGIPQVPADSWYAQPFTEKTRMSLTGFHMRHRGNVLFSNAYVPLGSSELEKLPGRSPPVYTSLDVGKDLIYGMAYLHNTPLFIEHQWRSRVAHGVKVVQQQQQQQRQNTAPAAEWDRMGCQRDFKTLYNRPYFDTFIGIKVFVDGQIVPDRYPRPNSLPGCTTTIDSSEAFNNWICVPFVLVGYLNNFMLGTISIYRFLSLNFVEYMLLQPIKSSEGELCEPGRLKNGSAPEESGGRGGEEARRSFSVRVDVVYGCRSELNFCTEYISTGSVELVMTSQSKVALKSYKDRLWDLIQGSRVSCEQVIPVGHRTAVVQQQQQLQEQQPLRKCLFCRSPLDFVCTICGAHVCGTTLCVWQPFAGYPHGCSTHKAQA